MAPAITPELDGSEFVGVLSIVVCTVAEGATSAGELVTTVGGDDAVDGERLMVVVYVVVACVIVSVT